MSEPARSLPPQDIGSRAAPGPLRDWLAAMRAQTPAEPRPAEIRPAETRQAPPEAPRLAARQDGRFGAPGDGRLAARAEAGWSPRLVPAAEAPAAAEDADVSELMAENMMLKAKLRLEGERQEALQSMLAGEIRDLRRHVQDEIGSIESLRAEQEEIRIERDEFRRERDEFRREREELRAGRDKAVAERDAGAAERHAISAERDALREERDLWRARTEALASPLFQQPQRR